MAAFLEKSTESKGFHQVIDFLSQSHIIYALTKKPEIYISFIKQFWRTTKASTDTDREVTITAIIDGQSKTITKASLRRHLKLDDHDGITSIPHLEIFEQLALIGYQRDSDKLTFQKGVFSPQWRFLIHTLLHCLSPKKTAWEQFSSNIATALICLATNRKYNFHRLIFEHMVTNIGSPHKFLMYPRLTKGYTKVEIGLFPTMLTSPTPESSPIPTRITSSPSPSSEPSTKPNFESQPSPNAEYHVPIPNESPLHVVHSHGSDEGSLKPIELRDKIPKKHWNKRDCLEKEAIRLQKQVDEEEKAQIARDEEIARQLLALDEERVTTKTKTTKDIDWNDPSVQKYWDLKNKPKSEAQARKNMIVYLKNQSNYKMKTWKE
ncbi:hypothetical protein Tco_1030528 [Tanacetum coccineum]|uniref:Synaptobrevin, longin-like domain protein n=1 Tax=Tanacetum coccineum TaxID=301880 RepID=A0ABQ5G8R2_9ASTR